MRYASGFKRQESPERTLHDQISEQHMQNDEEDQGCHRNGKTGAVGPAAGRGPAEALSLNWQEDDMRKLSDYYSKRVKLRKRRLLFKRVRFAFMFLALVFAVFFLHSLVSIAKNLPQQIKVSSQLIKQSPDLQKIQSTSQGPQSTPQQEAKEAENLDNLKTEIASYLTNYKGQYGVYYYDISSGQEFGINDEDQYQGASTEKIPINLYLYNQIKSGAVNPEGTLTYLQEDYEGGTGSIQYEKVGTQYTIADLSSSPLSKAITLRPTCWSGIWACKI